MLLRFEASNHRSIREPVELSMIAVDEDRLAARSFERIPEKVLTIASVYGPNASGKSNVLEALAWLSAAVASSLRQWEDFVPREAFRFGDCPEKASTFEIELMVKGVRHVYHLEVKDSEVVFESLYSYPERRRRVLFEREGMALHFRRGLSALSGVKELLTPTTLALSAARRLDEAEISLFARAMTGIGTLNFRRRNWRRSALGSSGLSSTMSMFSDSTRDDENSGSDAVDVRAIALSMLKLADLGIDDVEIIREEPEVAGTFMPRRLQLVHRVDGQTSSFEMSEESEGTRTWFTLIGPVLSALRGGQILLFDEIDASLHPNLSAHLLNLFQDPETNPLGAQLIFTTHDTSLLNHLNRDEVWLTEKGDDGATKLTALAEYGGDKVRRSTNLERAYLQGRFGAVPQIDQFALRHALGMAGVTQ